MAKHNILGKTGELLAAEYLENEGYQVLDRNWRCGHKELDIVARKGNTLVFVEVKTRGGTRFGCPEDAVDSRKIFRTVCAADAYIRLNCLDMDVRFDIVTIVDNDGRMAVEHIADAFFPPMECR
ncbi:MAG: YraN family protein [Bacteroidaceae bacterium]|nr:YraN family protein [Bacteroidaceae bacterium]